jgi:hypothetical protein
MDACPSITREHVLEYARIVRGHWESRAALAQAHLLESQIKTGSIADIPQAFARAAEQVTQLVRRETVELGCWATELGDLSIEPERETWLLWDELSNKPALPLGRAAMMSAAGGTGKTTSAVQLGVSVSAGLPWCGFAVRTPGTVVLCCAESDRKLMARHLWRACNALSLDAEQRATALNNILVMPLAGHEVSMLRGTAGNTLERSEFLTVFRNRLQKLAEYEQSQLTDGAQFVYSLVVLDPLARFAGQDTESNNSAATQFAQAIETLCELPGTPTVVCTHHSSKDSIRSGRNDSRGVSGLRDAFRAVLTLTRHKAESIVGVLLECDKSNEAPHFDSRWLVQLQGDCGGCLRLATPEESAVLQESAKRKKKTGLSAAPPMEELAKVSDPRDAIIETLEKHNGKAQSRRWLVDQIRGYRATDLYDGIKDLLNDGRIITGTMGIHKQAIYLAGPEPQMVLPIASEAKDGSSD